MTKPSCICRCRGCDVTFYSARSRARHEGLNSVDCEGVIARYEAKDLRSLGVAFDGWTK